MARTRMPPSGKMPVSIAATRTTSTTSLMSTSTSILAEYSIVKCGIARSLLLFGLKASSEVAAHRAIRSIVGLDRVALAGFDRADEGTRQHHLSGFERQSIGRDLVGEPGHRRGGMIEDAGRKPGLFELAVAETQRADPAQVSIHRPYRPAAEHDAGIRRVVGDGVENLPRRLGLRIDAFDPSVQNLQRRHHEVGGVEHVKHRAVRSRKPRLHHE